MFPVDDDDPGGEGDAAAGTGLSGGRERHGDGLGGVAGDVVGQLKAAADAMQTLGEEAVEGGELGDLLVEALAQCDRLRAGVAGVADRYRHSQAWRDDGSRSAGAQLARRCLLHPDDAHGLVRLGQDLREFTLLGQAFTEGWVSERHVRELAMLGRHPRYKDAFAEAEGMLVGYAMTMEWVPFAQAVDYWKLGADPDGAEAQAEDDYKARYVKLLEGLRGTKLLEGELSAIDGEAIAEALRRFEEELFAEEWAETEEALGREPTVEELPRTAGQRRHDALARMAHAACGTTPEQRRPAPLVSVLVDLDTFETAAQTTTCELGSGQVITPGQLAPLLGRAVIERIVFDGPARRLVEIGEQRTFTGAARRAIQILQRHCQHPGCHVPAHRCELDHVVPHSRGGATSLDNAQLLCPAHNRWKADRHPGQLPKPRGEPPPEDEVA